MCVSSASTGLCGGRRATAVPTATAGLQSRLYANFCNQVLAGMSAGEAA